MEAIKCGVYLTRGGKTAEVWERSKEGNSLYPFYGKVVDAEDKDGWDAKGRSWHSPDFDLVERVGKLPAKSSRTVQPEPQLYEFDRYVNGVLMAEGVTIERQTTLDSATREAARIASRGPNGEVPVLVLRRAPNTTIIHDSENHGPTLVRAVAECDKMARIIGAKPGSSIYSALSGAAAAILAMEEQGRAALGGHHE